MYTTRKDEDLNEIHDRINKDNINERDFDISGILNVHFDISGTPQNYDFYFEIF